MDNQTLKNGVRILFFLLLLYEWLSYFGILPIVLQFSWPGLLGTLIVVWAALEFLELFHKTGKMAPLQASTWLVAFIAVAIDAFGDLHHFYDRWVWYDRAAHFLGTAASTIVMIDIVGAIAYAERSTMTRFVQTLLAYGFSVTLASLFEVEEYLEDAFTGSERLGNGFDTADDMLMNFLGATTIFTLLLVTGNLRPRTNYFVANA